MGTQVLRTIYWIFERFISVSLLLCIVPQIAPLQAVLFCFTFIWSSVYSLDQSFPLELGNAFFKVNTRTFSPLSYKCEEIWKGEDYICVTAKISNTNFLIQ